MSDQQRPQRRWFQFTLRTLLVATAAAAGLAFAWVKTIEPYRLQREAMAAITKLGGTYKADDATGWVRYLDKTAQDVVVVDLADCDKPDEYLPHVARLPMLRTLVVGGHQVGNEQVAALWRVASLRGLVLDSTRVGDEGLRRLTQTIPTLCVHRSQRRAVAELERVGARVSDRTIFHIDASPRHAAIPPEWLRIDVGDAYFAAVTLEVALSGTRITDGDVAWLVNLPELQTLYVLGTSMGDKGLAVVADLPSLEYADIENSLVTDDGLAHVHRNKTLRRLSFYGARITDSGLPHLERLGQLTNLTLQRTGISPDGIRSLRKALPNCRIN